MIQFLKNFYNRYFNSWVWRCHFCGYTVRIIGRPEDKFKTQEYQKHMKSFCRETDEDLKNFFKTHAPQKQ